MNDEPRKADGGGNLHPDHDRLVATVRSWYTHSDEAMGYRVVTGPFGQYGHNSKTLGITPWCFSIGSVRSTRRRC